MHPRFVIFDVDDVLLDMDSLADQAIEAMADAWRPELGSDGQVAAAKVAHSYDVLRRALRGTGEVDPEHQTLMERIRGLQAGLQEDGFEVKTWSRDSMAAIALQDLGIDVTAKRVATAVDAYWASIKNNSEPFADAVEYCEYLRGRDVRMHCATNSDGFLYYSDERATFLYDPAMAVQKKHDRLKCLEPLGLPTSSISVGDPDGKPSVAFAEQVIESFQARAPEFHFKKTLVIGDSWLHDIQPLMQQGVFRGAWIKRADTKATPRPAQEDDGVINIRRLTELLHLDINEVLL